MNDGGTTAPLGMEPAIPFSLGRLSRASAMSRRDLVDALGAQPVLVS
jgi:hypothetical protein